MSATVIEIIGQQGPQGPQGPGPDFVDANITTTGTLLAGAGSVITGNSSTSALRVTQEGSGNALLIEDDVHPDNTPLVVNNVGQIISGATAAFDAEGGLQITSDAPDAPNGNLIIRRCTSAQASGAIYLTKTRGSASSPAAVQNSDALGNIFFSGYNGDTIADGARFRAIVDGAVSVGSMPARLELFTTASGSTTPTERMRITSSGNIGINGIPDAAAQLDVNSTTRGFLPPRMTTAQRDAISTPPAGLMVYNTTTNKLNFYNGTAWEAVTSS